MIENNRFVVMMQLSNALHDDDGHERIMGSVMMKRIMLGLPQWCTTVSPEAVSQALPRCKSSCRLFSTVACKRLHAALCVLLWTSVDVEANLRWCTHVDAIKDGCAVRAGNATETVTRTSTRPHTAKTTQISARGNKTKPRDILTKTSTNTNNLDIWKIWMVLGGLRGN